MRRAAKIDTNQRAIVEALRAAGCSVQPLHTVGHGVPDLLVGHGRQNYLLEIKRTGPPSARKLTEDEDKWHLAWMGQVATVQTIEEALHAVGLGVSL